MHCRVLFGMLECLTLVITDKEIAVVPIEASLHEANLHLSFYAKRTSVVCFQKALFWPYLKTKTHSQVTVKPGKL